MIFFFLVEMAGTNGISCAVQPVDILPTFCPSSHTESVISIFSVQRDLSATSRHIMSSLKVLICRFFALVLCDVHSTALQCYRTVV